MIDTHAHIDGEAFNEDLKQVTQAAFDSGLEYIIIPAIEPGGFDKLIETANLDDRIFCSIGVHPHNAAELNDDVLSRMEKIAKSNKTVAIGEIGLDYYYDFTPKDVQKSAFAAQLELAKKLNLPVIIHNRESDDDLIDLLQNIQDGSLRGVLHCFSGDEIMLRKALNLGFYISFTGNITFKKSKYDEIVKAVPLDRLLLETDSPYMTPVPYRGKRNEPKNVRLTAEKISDIKSISFEEVKSMTTMNAKKLFNLASVLIMLLILGSSAYSQMGRYNPKDFEDDYEQTEEVDYHPFEKFIGFGPYVGGNTIVDRYATAKDPTPVTFDGILSYGGAVYYGIFDFLVAEVAYMYAKNETNSKLYPGWFSEPNYHHVIEICTHWIPNPYGRINVFGTFGPTLFFNSIDGVESNSFGLNGGIGFFANIDTDYGLFNISAQWRVNFALTTFESTFVDRNNDVHYNTETSTFFSIPRAGLIWYPPFFENKSGDPEDE